MISFDFKTYIDRFINKDFYMSLFNRKEEVYQKFLSSSMIGWTKVIDEEVISDILTTRDKIKSSSSVLVVIGIGGSYLGSYALSQMFSKYFISDNFEVVYAGYNLSSKYLSELVDYLRDKDLSVNVISKSGTTLEITLAYQALLTLMKEKYTDEEIKNRIIITTDSSKGLLREEVNKFGYKSFVIPSDIGGRYSLFTAAHLLPLAFFLDIEKLITGFYNGFKLDREAYEYACVRLSLFKEKKYIENYCVYEPSMYYYTEWLKQLFGETEGKNGKGIFPISTVNTRDLHSLGQFIQEGNPIIFETFIKILNSNSFNINGQDLNNVNNIVLDSVMKAHYSGGVPCGVITLDLINEENIGMLCAFFMLSAAFSGYLFDVDPFNQPGVEVYKKFVRENL